MKVNFDFIPTQVSDVARGGRGEFWISFMSFFFSDYFEQPLLSYIANLVIVNNLTVLLNAQAQSCGNGPAISFKLRSIPASIIKI